MKELKKAAFFDRDGTLIEDVGYLRALDQISFIQPMIDIAQLCQTMGYSLFVVTNQSGVARGFFDEAFVQKTHQFLTMLLRQKGIFIQDFYYCPHHPDSGLGDYRRVCSCRKPAPGLLLQAAADYSLDLSQSLLFGDASRDIEAGKAAGCKSFLMQDLLQKTLQEVAKEIFIGTIEDSVR
ncbi:MAG: D,D-heptose 1,7-bisphosphate phosphatase [candidate division TM6 bacterium GW2011_GWF2_38_10]|nr:MAG: D,D-heptose 1,7-bisphosphate phosphatase [candidate division TM6 bacterium GW2011_GWF2_38_10]